MGNLLYKNLVWLG